MARAAIDGWARCVRVLTAAGAAMALVALVAPAAPAWAGVDDYPANLKAQALDAVLDPWRFYNRECTSFVAWRLNSRNGVAFNDFYGGPRWGNANTWDDAARSLSIPVDPNPAVGSVAQTDAGAFGHVAWVESVNGDGTVTIEEYNRDFTGHYGERRVAASAFIYIHVKDLAASLHDGSFVGNGDGRVYELVGGAPLYVSNWAAVGGQHPVTTVTPQQFAALRTYPADGTFVNTSTRNVYRIVGGAPFLVHAWSVFGGTQPSVRIDQWDVDNRADPHAHLRTVPRNGTRVVGLPSHAYWSFAAGHPVAAGASSSAIAVDDVGLAAYAQSPSRSESVVVPVVTDDAAVPAPAPSPAPAPATDVRRARRALRRSHCRLGKVRRPAHRRHGHVLRVRKQSARRGSRHRAGYRVRVTVSAVVPRHRRRAN